MTEKPAKNTTRTATPRGSLNRRLILDAVAATVAEKGVDAVTMRAIATDLKVDPMALYRHFRDKDALLAAFVDDVFAEIGPPEQSGVEGAKELARQYFRVLVAHPGLVNITLEHALDSPHQLLMGERIYRGMLDAGYDIETAVMVFSGLQRFVLGSALMYPRRTDPEDVPGWNRVRGLFRELDPERFPTLRQVNEEVPRMNQEEVFGRWLDWIFDPPGAPAGSRASGA
ncbi:TetR/AcrR family transcriptional regulator [Amycolatopsis eburnea]|uniref:TetR/AcrR family transcriptional regulator n=1 Tax=Amycolatopsis eburnea TaxID=2267691 RepID=A0A3R9EM82_9PSEU|nr:TetR/AcrR family transcriptional regulator [Amycolatopsis eburnea]RSD13163.1 TetR/AcrR family transcriptional regulator [Amycolatopsis eburnea]